MSRYLESCILSDNADEEGRPERGTVAGARAHLADIRRCLDELLCFVHEPADCSELASHAHRAASNRLMDLEMDIENLGSRELERRVSETEKDVAELKAARADESPRPRGVILDIPIGGEDGAS